MKITVVELREQLVHANISFATEIVELQESDTNALNQIVDAIAEIQNLGYKPSDYTKLTLIPPIGLILQSIESTMSSVGNISGTFQTLQLDIDPFFFLEQYVPHIDWEKFKAAALAYKGQKNTKTTIGNATGDMGGMGGGF